MIAVSSTFGCQWMLALRLDHELNRIILCAGLLNVALSMVLGNWYRQMGVATSLVLAEAFIAVGTILVLRRRSLDPWQALPDREEEALA